MSEPELESLELRLDKLRRERVDRFGTQAKDVPVPVYHYAPMRVLEPMLRTETVWATDAHFLNDTTELRYAFRAIAEHVRKAWWERARWLAEPVATALDNGRERPPYLGFIASFSQHRDSLSQWRAYADDGAGVAIGLDLSDLKTGLGDEIGEPQAVKCIYTRFEHEQAMVEVIDPQFELAVAEMNCNREIVLAVAQSVLVTAGLLGLVMKNHGFHEEAEWRIVAIAADDVASKVIQFRDTRFGPAPYLAIPFGSPLPVREIVLGPKTDPVAERSVRLMLERYGVGDAEITHSEASYR